MQRKLVSRVSAKGHTFGFAESEFLTTDGTVYFQFSYSGGHKGDKVRVEWVNPLGTVAQKSENEHPSDSDTQTWQFPLAVAGQQPSFTPGDWKVQLFLNDQGVAVEPFKISVPPKSALNFISRTELPVGTSGLPYSYQFTVAGGTPPYRWSVDGRLPNGVTLSTEGRLSGTPLSPAGYRFVVKAEDSAGNSIARAVGLGINTVPSNVGIVSANLWKRPTANTCPTGPGVSDFDYSAGSAGLSFEVDAAKTDDAFVEWLNPSGDVAYRWPFTHKSDGVACYTVPFSFRSATISKIGAWRVRLVWMQGEVFSVPFWISSKTALTRPLAQPPRSALLIGNGAYQHLQKISSAAQDVALLQAALKEDGFTKVETHVDVTSVQWKSIESSFLATLESGGVAVVYYAGYAFQSNGDNWLVPVNFDATDPRDLQLRAYSLTRLRQRMEEKKVRLKIFLLNGSRESAPLAPGALAKGLVRPEVDDQTVFCFAVPPGRSEIVKTDERTSPFAQALSEVLRRPGIGMLRMLRIEMPGVLGTLAPERASPITMTGASDEFIFRIATASDPAPARIEATVAQQAARLKTRVEPSFPDLSRIKPASGTLRLRVIVGENGRVRDATALSGPAALNRVALTAVKQWIYEPAPINGRPAEVGAEVELPYGGASPDLAGEWVENATNVCRIDQTGAKLLFFNKAINLISNGSFIDHTHVKADEWKATATIGADGKTLEWSNGNRWIKK